MDTEWGDVLELVWSAVETVRIAVLLVVFLMIIPVVSLLIASAGPAHIEEEWQ